MMYETMQQIRDANETCGDDFFNSGRIHVFWTMIHGDVINGNMFITSEQQTFSSQRLFTIRRAFANGLIETVGEFQQYEFYEDARDAARRLDGGAGGTGGLIEATGTVCGATLRWRGNSKLRIEVGDLWMELHPPDGSGRHSFFTLYSSSETEEISGREPETVTVKFDGACVDRAREEEVEGVENNND